MGSWSPGRWRAAATNSLRLDQGRRRLGRQPRPEPDLRGADGQRSHTKLNFARFTAEGKTKREIMRCLKRYNSPRGVPRTGFTRLAFAEWVIDEGFIVAVTDFT